MNVVDGYDGLAYYPSCILGIKKGADDGRAEHLHVLLHLSYGRPHERLAPPVHRIAADGQHEDPSH